MNEIQKMILAGLPKGNNGRLSILALDFLVFALSVFAAVCYVYPAYGALWAVATGVVGLCAVSTIVSFVGAIRGRKEK